jgi:hypothetical protein
VTSVGRVGRRAIVGATVFALSWHGSAVSHADDLEGSGLAGRLHDDGAFVSGSQSHGGGAKSRQRNQKAHLPVFSATGKRVIQRIAVPACPGNDPNQPLAFDSACALALNACRAMGRGTAPLQWIWERRLDSTGEPQAPWVQVGEACQAPPTGIQRLARPVLTRGLIVRAFREVDFARPDIAVQPVGNQTLVNFETFYRVTWPQAGVGPGEIATVTLLGRKVRIRPAVRTYTYSFGDGTSAGPTSDPGGVYPTGRIRHTYVSAGSVGVRVRAVYTGDFSVDGGPWESVDDTVTIAGPVAGLRVREARNQLEAGSEP